MSQQFSPLSSLQGQKGFIIFTGLLYLPIGLYPFVVDKSFVAHCVWQTTDELQFNKNFKEASL